jgi:hypothetical protein
VTVYEILDYVQSAFCDEAVLNSIPLQAAANPGAFHAWHTYQASGNAAQSETESRRASGPHASPTSPDRSAPAVAAAAANRPRRPGEWNWEGVWEERVKKGSKASLSEPVLFGTAAGGDDIVSRRTPKREQCS